jgi:hypothetical protein
MGAFYKKTVFKIFISDNDSFDLGVPSNVIERAMNVLEDLKLKKRVNASIARYYLLRTSNTR